MIMMQMCKDRSEWKFEEIKEHQSKMLSIVLEGLLESNPVMPVEDMNRTFSEGKGVPRSEIRRKYWAYALPFIKEAHGNKGAYRNVTTGKEYWLNGYMGINGFSVTCEVKMNRAAVKSYSLIQTKTLINLHLIISTQKKMK